MDELKRTLQAKADEMRLDPEMPPALRPRVRRHRLLNSTVALALVGSVGFGSYTGFRFALGKIHDSASVRPANDPQAGPTPGPTPTGDRATPGAVKVELFNASTDSNVLPYLTSLLRHGRGAHHGGYSVTTISETEGSEVSVIIHALGYAEEAERVARLFFPEADIRPGDPHPLVPLRIVVGEDFARRHAQALDAFAFVREFGAARSDADRADLFLGTEAASYYHAGENDGGSLYGYAKGCPYEVEVAEDPASPVIAAGEVDEFYLFFCRKHADSWTEIVRVAPVNGELRIVEAFLAMASDG